jgi:putative aminopeptidase FrvX
VINRIEKHLRELALLPGLSGYEQKVTAYMKARFEALGFPVEIDVFGNVIARISGTGCMDHRVMVFAHMDSLGFFVRYIEEDGFLRIERLGGIPEKVLPSTEVQVQRRDGGMVDGVIAIKAHHVTPGEEKYVVDRYMNLFIDIGAKSRGEVFSLGIDVGSPVVYKPNFTRLLGNRILMSAADNRAGCAVLLELAALLQESSPGVSVCLVGTVQEEYNLRGGMMAARTVKPDIAIAVDIAGSADTADLKGFGMVKMGGGPVISLYNFHGRGTLNGTIPHPAMVRLIEGAAKKKGIALQRSANIGSLTDLAYVQLEGRGIMCVDLGFPGRYAHSPHETVDMGDIEQLILLIREALADIAPDFDFSRNL